MRRTPLAISLAAALLVAPQRDAIAQTPSLPPGRTSDVARAWLDAVNAADSTRLLAWLRKYDPEGDLLVRSGRQMAIALRTGGFAIDRVVNSSNDAIELVLREKNSGDRVQFALELSPSGIAAAFGLQPLRDGASPPPPQRSSPTPAEKLPNEESLVQHTQVYLDSLTAADAFSGVVSITRNGVPVFEKAYGYANRDTRTPNTLETRFNLGSINKLFTATAIRQLAAAGRLSLDSTLAKAWPEYPNQEVARQVTIRQLLNHRSGIMGNIFEVPGTKSPSDVRHNRQLIAALASAPLAYPPGSREEYSNFGYVVLGGVVERVSGVDYYDYIEQHVYAPLGMTHSGHFEKDKLPEATAIGYSRQSGTLQPNRATLPGRGSAAGGGYSNLEDLKKLMAALRRGGLPGGPPAGIGAAGGAPGINSAIEGDVAGGYDIIVLTNFDPPAAMRVAQQLRGWLGARD